MKKLLLVCALMLSVGVMRANDSMAQPDGVAHYQIALQRYQDALKDGKFTQNVLNALKNRVNTLAQQSGQPQIS